MFFIFIGLCFGSCCCMYVERFLKECMLVGYGKYRNKLRMCTVLLITSAKWRSSLAAALTALASLRAALAASLTASAAALSRSAWACRSLVGFLYAVCFVLTMMITCKKTCKNMYRYMYRNPWPKHCAPAQRQFCFLEKRTAIATSPEFIPKCLFYIRSGQIPVLEQTHDSSVT